jgi:hypothetical protein
MLDDVDIQLLALTPKQHSTPAKAGKLIVLL